MSKILNVCVGLKRDNSDKKDWHTIGTITLLDSGSGHLNLKSLPLTGWDGHANLFPKEERGYAAPKKEEGKEDGYMPPASDESAW